MEPGFLPDLQKRAIPQGIPCPALLSGGLHEQGGGAPRQQSIQPKHLLAPPMSTDLPGLLFTPSIS